MRVLVVGAAGQVGRSLVRRLEERGDTAFGGYASRAPPLPEDRTVRMDKTDPSTLTHAIDRSRPDWVVDTGAIHNVDYCETHEAEAMAVNRDGTATLAGLARYRGAGYLFVSTDFVFDGSGHPPYREEDPPRPLSVYGRSKREGEIAAAGAHPGAIVVRPSVIYSWIPPAERTVSVSQKGVNFGSWVLDQLSDGKEVAIVNDQVASPTLAADVADAILSLLDRPAAGTFHTAGATAMSRFEFVRQLARAVGLSEGLIRPTDTASLRQTALRPSNSSLDSGKLTRISGHRMLAIPDALRTLSEEWRTTRPARSS